MPSSERFGHASPGVGPAGADVGSLEKPVVDAGLAGVRLEQADLGQDRPRQTWRCLGEGRWD